MTHYQLVAKNKQKTWFIMIGFIGFITASAYFMAQAFGYGFDFVGFALIFSGIGSFLSYYFSDKIILTLSSARPAAREEFFDFYTVAENIAISQRMPMPKLYVIKDTAMNAFATGRDPKHAVVCATTGLLNRLNRAEIEGVIAHEMAHIHNYDMRLMSIVSILVGLIALMSDWMFRASRFGGRRRKKAGQIQGIMFIVGLLLAMLSPLIAKLIQLAISRNREYLADSTSVAFTKNPEGLARALEKIAQDIEPLEAANKATAHLYIANPLKNRHDAIGWFANLFATHPPMAERVSMIRALAV